MHVDVQVWTTNVVVSISVRAAYLVTENQYVSKYKGVFCKQTYHTTVYRECTLGNLTVESLRLRFGTPSIYPTEHSGEDRYELETPHLSSKLLSAEAFREIPHSSLRPAATPGRPHHPVAGRPCFPGDAHPD